LTDEMRLGRRTMTLPPRPENLGPGSPEPGAADGDDGPGEALPTADPEELFNRAYADYSRKNYPLAAWQFGEFLRVHPDSSLSDDAQYWIGECHFAQGDYQEAATAFEGAIARYPAGDKVPAAHLKSGLAYLELRMTKEAVLQLRHVIDTYPGTDEARIAGEQLRQRGLGLN
jgi:tol-pal system protein YbgF